MRAEYKRDMNHNYLILHGDAEVDTASYQVRMMVGNGIRSLLKCRIQGMDGEFLVYYDITSRQPVSSLYEEKKLGIDDLKLIFGGFVQVMEDMSEYLLNPQQLVLKPEYIYMDMEKGDVFFCYLPGFQEDVKEQFQTLTEYILPRLDHEDGSAVMLGYGVYRQALEDSFHLEHLKEELYRVREAKDQGQNWSGGDESNIWAQEIAKSKEKKPKIPSCEKRSQEVKKEPDIKETFFFRDSLQSEKKAEEQTSEKPWAAVAGCIAALAVIMGILAAKFLGYLPEIELEKLLGGILVGMGAGMLIYLVVKKRDAGKGLQMPEKNSRRNNFMKSSIDVSKPWDDSFLFRKEEEDVFSASEKQEGEHSEEVEGHSLKSSEKIKEKQTKSTMESYGETVVLSANPVNGPSSLVSREPGELATIYLNEDLTVIGKLESAVDYAIGLPTVSRVHAKIRKKDGEFYLTDLNSRNGTSVNGRMLKEEETYLLQDQDQVDFAQARYVFIK